MNSIFFDGWEGPIRILLAAPIAYGALILFLRLSGKRTLAKLNAFDLVVTVALGSALSTQILSRQTPVLDGVLAVAALIGLQWAVAFVSVRSRRLRELVRATPTLLLKQGELQHATMRRERVTRSEVLQAVRSEGGDDLSNALVVYLQTDGSMAVILR